MKAALIVLFSGLVAGACGSSEDVEKPAELTNEMSDRAQALKSAIGQLDITPGQVLGERCFDDHSCIWEQLPSPVYPSITGVGEATCEVWLTVGDDGRAQDVSVDCDDPRFNRATEIGLSTLKYRVKDSCGKTCSMIGRRIQYPIEYRFED